MQLSKLYIKDFMCYDDAFIDFNEFSTALIVGKTENNSFDVSNGVGKTTIFRAIEYVLFGHADVNLENIIRDDIDKCSITFDFVVDQQEYRLSRTRTRKGVSDLTLYKKLSQNIDAYHTIKGDRVIPTFDKSNWEDISGRRASDTEKEVSKLVGVNLKSFRIFVHFLQRDFGGLAVATPENRKKILKDALNLAVYSKLEKIAKDKYSALSKEADRFKMLIDNYGDIDISIKSLNEKLLATNQHLIDISANLDYSNSELILINSKIQELTTEHSNLENKFSSLILQQQSFNSEKIRLEISVKEYTTKKTNVLSQAKELIGDIKKLEEQQKELSSLSFAQIEYLTDQIVSNKETIAQQNLTIQNDMTRIEKLKKPLPIGAECEECRQPISTEHRSICQDKIAAELQEKQAGLQKIKKDISNLNIKNAEYQKTILQLTQSKQQLETVSRTLVSKKKELEDKKSLYEEYNSLLDKFKTELSNKNKELEDVIKNLENSSLAEAKNIKDKINTEKTNLTLINSKIGQFNKELNHFNNAKAIMEHDLKQKIIDQTKKEDYKKLLDSMQDKLTIYPSVIQGFSSIGIPNLIIQNVLDDLQIEANNLLAQLKPGLQLSFSVQKEDSEEDTLDINYTVNGRKRYYENISGAMQLAVNFSLKLGLSFFLQKMAGINVKFLLLDEIDQSLDKASTDFFADIVKFFQKDYTILVITHNNALKDRFSSAILVEQDTNMVSRAKVVSSW